MVLIRKLGKSEVKYWKNTAQDNPIFMKVVSAYQQKLAQFF